MEQLCIICAKEKPIVQNKSCSCQYCYECGLLWIEAKLQEKANIYNIACLNYNCHEKIDLQSFYDSTVDKNLEVKFQEIMFRHYLTNSNDIRACPNAKCQNYGTIPVKRCSELLECSECNYKWIDKDCITLKKSCKLFIKNSINDLLCFFQEFYYAHQCPNCDVLIIKNGGCNHMTCKSCKYEYCYICGEKHQQHDSKLCEIKGTIFSLIISYLAITEAYLLGIFYLLSKLFIGLAYLFYEYVLINNKILFLFIFHCFQCICKIANEIKDHRYYGELLKKEHAKHVFKLLMQQLAILPIGIIIYYVSIAPESLTEIYVYLPLIIQIFEVSSILVLVFFKWRQQSVKRSYNYQV